MSEGKGRLNEILDSSIIIDTLSHGPLLWTDDLVALGDEMIAADQPVFRIAQDLWTEHMKKFALDDKYYAIMMDAWKTCGANCVSYTIGVMYEKIYSYEGAIHNYSLMMYVIDSRKESFLKVLKAEDIERAYKEGKFGIILNFQNMQHIGNDLDLIDQFYMMGFRVNQLTYNTKNQIGTGCTARRDKGLTEFGLEVVERLNNLGSIVDVSHCGNQTSLDAVEHSKDPIIASHTSAKKVFDHDRGKTDEFLHALAEKGGYVGVLAVPGFITKNLIGTVKDWANHIEYIVDLVGINHVGIGTDYMGYSLPENVAKKFDELAAELGFQEQHRATFTEHLEGFENYSKFPNLIQELISRGYSNQEIKKIAGENFLRVFRQVVG